MSTLWTQMRHLNPYEIHKLLINEYVLKKPGDTAIFKRDTSKDKTDVDVITQHHKFLWDEEDKTDSWELQFAKKYYDKLFKEYCIGDLRLYKENKIALRWRTENEVIMSKGQFICGNKNCMEKNHLRTWEVNFAYVEHGLKKNALIKIRLCPDCSNKLNYHSKKREIRRLKNTKYYLKKSISLKNDIADQSTSTIPDCTFSDTEEKTDTTNQDSIISMSTEDDLWKSHKQIEIKSREEEMDDYLQDLLV